MQRTFFHNLRADVALPNGEAIVRVDGQTVSVVQSDYEDGELTVYLRDETTDLDMPVTLLDENGDTLFSDMLPRTIDTIWETAVNNADSQLIYTSQLVIEPAAVTPLSVSLQSSQVNEPFAGLLALAVFALIPLCYWARKS